MVEYLGIVYKWLYKLIIKSILFVIISICDNSYPGLLLFEMDLWGKVSAPLGQTFTPRAVTTLYGTGSQSHWEIVIF